MAAFEAGGGGASGGSADGCKAPGAAGGTRGLIEGGGWLSGSVIIGLDPAPPATMGGGITGGGITDGGGADGARGG